MRHGDTIGPTIKVTFPFHRDDVTRAKSLVGRQYHSSKGDKHWTCPLIKQNVQMLQRWGFHLDKALVAFSKNGTLRAVSSHNNNTNEGTKIRRTKPRPIHVPTLKLKLYPFQEIAVGFLEARNGRALIGDEMGLGKTIEVLAWLEHHPTYRPAIVVCPASVKLNWAREARRCLTRVRVMVLSGAKPRLLRVPRDAIIIINYDILNAWKDELTATKRQVLILDEVHYIKSNSAKRTRAVKIVAKGTPYIIGLSGTPLVNRPIELYNAIKLVEPTLFPNRWEYAQRYCGLRYTHFGWNSNGAIRTSELHRALTRSVMLRRLKKHVLRELPNKIYSYLPMELSNTNEYKLAEEGFITWLEHNVSRTRAMRASGAEALAQIEVLKQVAVRGKMQQMLKWIHDFLSSGNKLVAFAVHRFVINRLMEEFGQVAVKIDGSVSTTKRQLAVDRFQSNRTTRLLVGNIRAAGVGINLTAASAVAFLELPWTPGEVTQAEDRCHRIGQRDTVNVYYLLAAGTIEERIAKLIDKKRKVLDSVLDGVATGRETLIVGLMRSYNSAKNKKASKKS